MNLQKNIPKVLALNFSWSFLLIQSVIVPFFASRGLTLPQVFALFTVFSLTLCALDVPTGYLSDILGRRRILLLASLFKGLGGMLLAATHGFAGYAAAYTLIGIGNSLFSGTDSALLFESRAALPEAAQKQLGNLFGRRTFYSQLGLVAASLAGGGLAAVSLDVAIWANALFAWVPLLLSWWLVEPPRLASATSHRERAVKMVRALRDGLDGAGGLFAAAMLYGAAPVVGSVIFQEVWRQHGLALFGFGYATALYQLCGAASGRVAHRVEARLGRRGTLWLLGVLPVVGFWGASGHAASWALLFGLALEACRGLGQVVFLEAIHARVTSNVRATASSVVSFGSRLIVAGTGPLVGWLSDSAGYPAALRGLALFYGVMLVALVWLSPMTFRKPQEAL